MNADSETFGMISNDTMSTQQTNADPNIVELFAHIVYVLLTTLT
jgi:hypothetical protein